MHVADIDPESSTIVVRTGKSKRVRVVHLDDPTAKAVRRWVRFRAAQRAASRPEWFLGKLGRLTGAGVLQSLHRRLREVGLPAFGPHALRRAFAISALDAGLAESELQAVAKYTRQGAQKRAAARARDLGVGRY